MNFVLRLVHPHGTNQRSLFLKQFLTSAACKRQLTLLACYQNNSSDIEGLHNFKTSSRRIQNFSETYC